MKSRLITLKPSGARIEVVEAGEGRDLLFLHGAGGHLLDDPLLAALSRRYHLVAPLLPGYGRSTGEDGLRDMLDITLHALDVMQKLDLRKPIMVGHSMGGMIAAEMAAIAHTEITKLCLIAPAGLWNDDDPVVDIFSKLPYELPALLFHDAELGRKLMTAGAGNMDDPEFLKQFLVANARRLGMAGKILFPIPDRGLAQRLYRITARTVLIWGKEDALIPVSYGDAFRKAIPDAKLVKIDKAGHAVGQEKPAAVLKAIREFF
ncbi:Pimeloyl-ACP methyl ester carboxylesterase [Enhydrobacter aerosaccus]|uniref:Pimeloyl-ACP methyl ester carboxylesterase n=1 Tax=Enhydrobacter aerosaccus TaxID=225324 RepID=A0A1T4JRV9_9HYPH|nr:alpha/beta hydrolase [Enhydrobacter aerosaccus]SJZ32879.1 Pimeloyl-ACP methyl ester carboxylesterase [Enhydrobacter aerosaccus]